MARGLTLVELVIVITIIGVLTAAISIGVMQAQKRANLGAAKTACSTVRQATMQWKAVHPGEDCPSVDILRK
ncbi:MAG TPA: type II secretion system protein, partial [Polyangiaceae bacterium]|nr:type II secretion system protein [Polyangiaceae bacterium]